MRRYEWVVETQNGFEEPKPVSTVATYREALADVVKYAELAELELTPGGGDTSTRQVWFLRKPYFYDFKITVTKVELVPVE